MISDHLKSRYDALRQTVVSKATTLKASAVGIAGAAGSTLPAGAGNYTSQYSATSFASAAGGLQDAFAFLVDCLTGMGNWYVTNAMGQLYIAMACVMFVFILIKSLFRHSGGKRK